MGTRFVEIDQGITAAIAHVPTGIVHGQPLENVVLEMVPTQRSTRHARSMASCLRQFLTPQVWKQARRGLKKTRKDARWDFHHLILVTLAMTWSLGESTPERFEMARGIVAICRPKRRRAGSTALGFQKALCRLPMRPLLALAGALRYRLLSLLGDGLVYGGFIPLGCDGSRLECCRNDELLARMGQAGKKDSSPTMWVTALVHLTTGVPWSWWLGRGNASERDHLQRLLPSLPRKALVVTDAGYDGYDLAVALLASGASFLIRMSSKTHLFVNELTDLELFSQGRVSYWPGRARQAKRKPLELRLIRVSRRRGKDPRRAVDVWLLTNVKASQMSITRAASFYRLRWENEVRQADCTSRFRLYPSGGPPHSGRGGVARAGPMGPPTPTRDHGATAMQRDNDRPVPPRQQPAGGAVFV
jgi:Transposase DDE domain